jgi:lipid A 3-O-deacylase
MIIRAAAAALSLACDAPALAIDGFSLEAGRGEEGTDSWRVGLVWKWDKQWFAERAWRLGAYWELQLGQWKGPISSVTDLSITPVFRLEPSAPGRVAPYVEGAIGFHFLSDYRISRRRSFSTKFQFGDHIGAGLRFGKGLRHDVGVRLQHLSNAGLREPNPGINFLQLRYQHHFE